MPLQPRSQSGAFASQLLAKIGDLPQVLDLKHRTLIMFQKFLPPEHPSIQTARENLVETARRMNSNKS
jgi:hypothetical protein